MSMATPIIVRPTMPARSAVAAPRAPALSAPAAMPHAAVWPPEAHVSPHALDAYKDVARRLRTQAKARATQAILSTMAILTRRASG